MKIAFLGTGLMGRPMAERLLSSGHLLVVYNRTREKAVAAGLGEADYSSIYEAVDPAV
jgi:3-hydroxyisobutyrate dehydrogenase